MNRAALVDLDPALLPFAEAGMPEGVFPLAVQRAVEAAERAGRLLGTEVSVDALAVALLVHLPEVMAAAYSSSWWPTPPPPRPAPGGGWFNAELGSPENAESFGRLMASLPANVDAPAVAAAAQEWRLPVCDYRPPAETPPWREATPASAPITRSLEPELGVGAGGPEPQSGAPEARSGQGPALTGLRVLDLTSMWAGPLTTWLLAGLGADVVKIEPEVRPDGFRASQGRGVWPGGRARRCDGSESGVFNALNSDKRSWAVDAHEDATVLRSWYRSADLVVDSFSPRVMGQLGLNGEGCGPAGRTAAERADGPRRLSMPAFPRGPLRQWVAYGTGVHALSGLGHQPGRDGTVWRPPAVTYPDALAGLQGAVAALDAAAADQSGGGTVDREVSLAAALEALLDRPRRLLPSRAGTGPALLRAGVESGSVISLQDGAGRHWYPASPFRFSERGDPRPAPARALPPPEGALPWAR